MTFKPVVSTFADANSRLDEIVQQIELKTIELVKAREIHLTAKATYEQVFSRHLLETKIKNAEFTAPEVKAQAVSLSFNEKMEAIKAESTYRRLLNEIQSLRDRLDSQREISYNLRAESKL